jgi:L-amino acid N-acyltransferase YncA
MKIRQATEEDLPDILVIYNDAVAHTTAVFDYQAHTLDMRRDWLRTKQAAGLPVFVATDDALIGFGTYGPFRPWPAYRYSVEHSVYVHPGARRQGVGTALVRAIIEHVREKDLHVLVAGITGENVASLRLHERLGFQEVGHVGEVGYKFGRWLDLKFLRLLLDGPKKPSDMSAPSR